MSSRIEKYYTNDMDLETSSHSTRSSRNARLYRQVYGKYEGLDNLPIDDNTDEIDMDKLKELVLNNETKQVQEEKDLKASLHILEQKKRRIDEQKLYDINQILEKAKYENNKLKSSKASSPKLGHNLLSTLQSTELSISEIQKAEEGGQNNLLKEQDSLESDLSMTRELKYQNLGQVEEKVVGNLATKETDEDLSLDLLTDLKPTGNTIITKPIREEESEKISVSRNFHSSDTRDIDIIRPEKTPADSDFFTSSYEFSQSDFASDDDFSDLKKKGGLFKILLLILAITIFVGVIVYFIGTYGLGI